MIKIISDSDFTLETQRTANLFIQSAPEQGYVFDPARQIGGWVSYNVDSQRCLNLF